MGNPKRIEIGDLDSGICIEYVASRKVLYIWGWYDNCVGIAGEEIPLKEFCEKLGIRMGKSR